MKIIIIKIKKKCPKWKRQFIVIIKEEKKIISFFCVLYFFFLIFCEYTHILCIKISLLSENYFNFVRKNSSWNKWTAYHSERDECYIFCWLCLKLDAQNYLPVSVVCCSFDPLIHHSRSNNRTGQDRIEWNQGKPLRTWCIISVVQGGNEQTNTKHSVSYEILSLDDGERMWCILVGNRNSKCIPS